LWYGATDLVFVVLEDITAECVVATFNVFLLSFDLAALSVALIDSIFLLIGESSFSLVFELGDTPNFFA